MLVSRTLAVATALLLYTGAQAQWKVPTRQGCEVKEVIVVPASYHIDSSFTLAGSEKTEKSKDKGVKEDFASQLQEIATKAAAGKHYVVLQLTRIEDHKQSDDYRFWGKVYVAARYREIENQIEEAEAKRARQSYASVTVYRPAYTGGFNDDSITYDLQINDTLKVPIKAGQQCVFKVSKEGRVRVTVKHKDFVQNIDLDVQHGKSYYVRNYTNFPGSGKYVKAGDMKVRVRGYSPYLDLVSEQQGAIESSMLKGMMIMKRMD